MTSAKNGSEMDSTTNPTAVSVPARRDRAIASGSKRRSSMAARTRCRVTDATRGSSFRTREAVRRLTPAAFATSRSLVGPLAGRCLLGRFAIDGIARFCPVLPSMARQVQPDQGGFGRQAERGAGPGGSPGGAAPGQRDSRGRAQRQRREQEGLIGVVEVGLARPGGGGRGHVGSQFLPPAAVRAVPEVAVDLVPPP